MYADLVKLNCMWFIPDRFGNIDLHVVYSIVKLMYVWLIPDQIGIMVFRHCSTCGYSRPIGNIGNLLYIPGRFGNIVLHVVPVLCVPHKDTTATFQWVYVRDCGLPTTESLQTGCQTGWSVRDQNCQTIPGQQTVLKRTKEQI